MGGLTDLFAQNATGGDQLFRLLLLLGLISIFALILAVDIIIWRYRRSEPSQKGRPTAGGPGLSAVAAIGASILAITIFYFGFKPFISGQVPPAGALEISVHADTTAWRYTYANGYISEQLHLPSEEPVSLSITAETETRRFAIPALNVNRKAIPGHIGSVWFEPAQVGYFSMNDIHPVTELADSSSADYVVVHEPGRFAGWLLAANDPLATMTPVEAGPIFIQRFGCAQCHSIDGVRLVGPSFKDAFGGNRLFTNGETISADSTYLVQSILSPAERIVSGFEPVMPSFTGQIDERQAAAIVAFIKSISVSKEEK